MIPRRSCCRDPSSSSSASWSALEWQRVLEAAWVADDVDELGQHLRCDGQGVFGVQQSIEGVASGGVVGVRREVDLDEEDTSRQHLSQQVILRGQRELRLTQVERSQVAQALVVLAAQTLPVGFHGFMD